MQITDTTSAQTPDRDCRNNNEAEVDGQRGVCVDKLKHFANFPNKFHSVVIPSVMRDELEGGVCGTALRPAIDVRKHHQSRVSFFPLAVSSAAGQHHNTPQVPKGSLAGKMLDDALATVTNPAGCADRPLLRRMAWVILMAARGRKVNHAQLATMGRHLPAMPEQNDQARIA